MCIGLVGGGKDQVFFSKYVYNESNLAVEIPFNVKPYVAEKILRGPNVG